MPETLIRTTTSLCRDCKISLPAEIWHVSGQILLRKTCPEHGVQEALISSNAEWYFHISSLQARVERPLVVNREVAQGCPFDCGACAAHEQRLHLPVVPITSACNLDCPICYTHNKNTGAYHMSPAEMAGILEHLRQTAPERRIINITGGEPTQHPQFLELIELCHEQGLHRITVSTHGLRFLKDEWLLEKLAAIDARVVLSFDSFKADVNKKMLGGQFLEAKLRVLELLEKHGVNTTLLPVLARGLNDDEIDRFVELALTKDFIRSIEFHPMAFTGQSGASFSRSARYTTYDALSDLQTSTGGALRIDDFVPSPAAHPLCYLVSYLLRLEGGQWLPLTRFMGPEDLRDLLAGGLYLEPGVEVERKLQDVINRLWAGDIACENTATVLAALKRMTNEIFAPGLSEHERMAVAERHTKAIYVHTHMDEETFDTDRIRQCCVGIAEPDGTNIPSCAYNILYRERDSRFATRPAASLITLGTGRPQVRP